MFRFPQAHLPTFYFSFLYVKYEIHGMSIFPTLYRKKPPKITLRKSLMCQVNNEV